MGADENDKLEELDRLSPYADAVLEKLDHGWRISSLPDGQLLLVPPPSYGEPIDTRKPAA